MKYFIIFIFLCLSIQIHSHYTQTNTKFVQYNWNEFKDSIAPVMPTDKINPKNLKELKKIDNITLTAMLVNRECRNCDSLERKAVANVLYNRVIQNYGNYGQSYIAQIFAGNGKQFSGMKLNRKNKRFNFNPNDKHCVNAWKVAKEIIWDKKFYFQDSRVVEFCNPITSSNKRQVRIMNRYQVETPEYFKHGFNINPRMKKIKPL
jgi:hypothetical protein